jgi:hypothetical protein
LDIVLNVCIGIALAATCGFRIFVPLLALSVAGLAGVVDLGSSFQWIGTYQAVIVFSAATLVEILAYFIPYVDNILDAASVPFSVMAGVVVTAAVMTDVSPILRWAMAIIAGGGAAAAGSLVSNGVHAASTLASGGAANPVVSTVESTGSVVASILAVAVPILAVVLIVAAIFLIYRFFIQAKRRGRIATENGEASP